MFLTSHALPNSKSIDLSQGACSLDTSLIPVRRETFDQCDEANLQNR